VIYEGLEAGAAISPKPAKPSRSNRERGDPVGERCQPLLPAPLVMGRESQRLHREAVGGSGAPQRTRRRSRVFLHYALPLHISAGLIVVARHAA